MTTSTQLADIREIAETLPVSQRFDVVVDERGVAEAYAANDAPYLVRLWDDDGTIQVVQLTNDAARLASGRASFVGLPVEVVVSAISAMLAD